MADRSHASAGGDEAERLLASAVQAFEQHGEAGLQDFLAAHQTEAPQLREGLERLRRLGILTPPPPVVEPQRYGEFRVIRQLATGGMGVVYLAEQTSLQRRVALKVVRPELLLSEHARERFRREVETIARLQHPGIVPILVVGTEGVVPWFAMEYVDGHTIDVLLAPMRDRDVARASGSELRSPFAKDAPGSEATGPFGGSYWEACVRLVLQVATTMSYVHARGIVHRDLKPSNLIVTPQGQVLILDFGLAHVQDQQRLTRQEAQVGSPAYMAPEQVRGEAVDERVDVYGLGVVLYQLLAARLPFEAGSTERLKEQILAGGARSVRTHNRSVPRDLDVVCQVAIDRDRARRYASMAEFATDLEAVLARQPVRARPLGTAMRFVRGCQRHPVWTVAGAAALVLACQFPLVLWWSQAESNRRLQAANEQLERANRDLAAQRTVAAADFRDARTAVDEMLSRIGHEGLAATPGTVPLRQTLLDRAAQLYERLRQRHGDDVELRLDAARTEQYLGSLYSQTGDAPAAERSYARSIDLVAGLDSALAAGMRGVTWKLRGQLCEMRGRLQEAERFLRDADCELADAVARAAVEPVDTGVFRQHAEVLNSLALVRRDQGDRGEALDLLRRAQAAKERLLVEAPQDLRNALAFATGCSSLSSELTDQGQAEEAMALLDRGIAELVARRPEGVDGVEFRARLAAMFDRRGTGYQERGELDRAAADLGIAFALRRELQDDFPSAAAHSARVGATLHNLAMVESSRGRDEAALELDEDAIRQLRSALRMAPGVREYRRNLEYSLTGRAFALLKLRRLDALVGALDELAADAATTDGLLNAARMRVRFSEITTEAAADAAAGERAKRAREQAAADVAAAVERGFRDRAHFTTGRFANLYRQLVGLPAYDAALARLPASAGGKR